MARATTVQEYIDGFDQERAVLLTALRELALRAVPDPEVLGGNWM